ncbi:MAG TPA: N-acetylmuramoyl-L-alanine amidase [Candidatus Aquicultor sp.]|jgi:N-acetylmuramoyl-L-alanine amidase
MQGFDLKTNRALRVALFSTAMLILFGVVFAGTYALMRDRDTVTSGDRVTVPAFVGRNLEQVKHDAAAAGLNLKIDEWVASKVYSKNQVVAQKPLPNATIEPGKTVVIKVSAGKSYQSEESTTAATMAKDEDLRPLPNPPIQPPSNLAQNVPAGKVVVIDPGHQQRVDLSKEPIGPGSSELKVKNPGGAQGVRTRTPEYVVALEIAEKLERKLRAQGIKVIMTRESNNVTIGNVQRAQVANNAHADLFVRVHQDSSTDRSKHGISTLYPAKNKWTAPIYSQSLEAAKMIEQTLLSVTKATASGIVPRNDLTGFNWAQVPSVLVEAGFLSNPQEDLLLNSDSYQDLIADGLSKGIISYLQSAQ